MGTLGQHLRSAREAKEIDIRDASQQTRININYLKALEEEDFGKLPGEVFVKGFLKNYGKFLNLDEADILRRYAELRPQAPAPAASTAPAEPASAPADAPTAEQTAHSSRPAPRRETPIEPFVWGALISISLLVFLFSSLPSKHAENVVQGDHQAVPGLPVPGHEGLPTQSGKPEKLYLEVVALEDTWLLVRTDTSPQKKAVLKKGESLIWSADERFLLSYGRVTDVKLVLNGDELVVKGTKETTVRDLAITRAGVLNQPVAAPQPVANRPKPQPAVQRTPAAAPAPAETRPVPAPSSAPAAVSEAPAPAAPAPADNVQPPAAQ